MFINLSNHPSSLWSEEQLQVAHQYGEIEDIHFPDIDPRGDSNYVDQLVEEYFRRVTSRRDPVVMLQGEFVFTFRLAAKLKAAGIPVLASCSERKVITKQKEDGTTVRESVFEFVRFREY